MFARTADGHIIYREPGDGLIPLVTTIRENTRRVETKKPRQVTSWPRTWNSLWWQKLNQYVYAKQNSEL